MTTPEPLSTAVEAGTEAAVIRDLAQQAVDPAALDAHQIYSLVVPEGSAHEIVDLERFLVAPRRKKGTRYLHDQDSFFAAVTAHRDPRTEVYADKDTWSLTAVLNDHAPAEPGWGDHRAVFSLRQSREWKRWAGKNGQLMSQEEFAQHIEDGLEEIVDPPAADMLELAQTFHAKTGVTFQSSHMLSSGQRQFSYVEDTQASAGGRGELVVPTTFTLAVSPFEGVTGADGKPVGYKVLARFRFRLGEGHLKLGYRLVRPEDVIEDAFKGVVDQLDDRFASAPILRGAAPEPR